MYANLQRTQFHPGAVTGPQFSPSPQSVGSRPLGVRRAQGGQAPGPGSGPARGQRRGRAGEPGAGHRREGRQAPSGPPETAGCQGSALRPQCPLGRPLQRPRGPPSPAGRAPAAAHHRPGRDSGTLGPSPRPRTSGLDPAAPAPAPRPRSRALLRYPRQAGLAALRGRPVPVTGSEAPRREAPAEARARPLSVSVVDAAAAAAA